MPTQPKSQDKSKFYASSKPYTRWWWFSGEIGRDDITCQLDWLKTNGFGGVEIAWVYPQPGLKPGPAFLSKEWTEIVAFAKEYAESIGLGCDLTFGTMWPFGGSMVDEPDASKIYGGLSPQRLRATWEITCVPEPTYLIDHLDRNALARYSEKIGNALKPALNGSKSGLFCDSWEVETEKLWTGSFGDKFSHKYGYRVEDFMDSLDEHPDIRYDYRKLIAEYVLNEFFKPFAEICRATGGFSRVQCHGAPCDLLAAYGEVDIPETEAILFEPFFARIAASAAALAGKDIVSCETFTCLYGWKPRPGPAPYIRHEFVADMKLLADSIFVSGVNQIIWHGMPYNPSGGKNEFYATVHVGPDSAFADEIKPFNEYMEKVSSFMRRGRTYSDVAVYMPIEDAWMSNRLPDLPPVENHIYPPDAKYHWEFRYTRMPDELRGYNPLWVSAYYLSQAYVRNNRLVIGDAEFRCLYVDAEWIEEDSMNDILRLAENGLPVCLRREPKQPGRNKSNGYNEIFKELVSLPNVSRNFGDVNPAQPLVKGDNLPEYWCRIDGDSYFIFFANPKSKQVTYPMKHGQSYTEDTVKIPVEIILQCGKVALKLVFEPYQSILVEVNQGGEVRYHDITFVPKTPASALEPG